MKGIYIYERQNVISIGVERKIDRQCDEFRRNGIECEKFPVFPKGGSFYKVAKRIPLATDNIDWQIDQILKLDIQFIYIRKTFISVRFISVLKKIRRKKTDIKVILEIPTYPYDCELISQGLINVPILFRESMARHYLAGLVDLLAVVGETERRLWNIETVEMYNGIDVNNTNVRDPKNDDDVIRVVCAANFSDYHGVDRFIDGMKQYYLASGKRKIELYLAGSGTEKYESQVANSEVEIADKIFFLGKLNPKQMDCLYDECDIGIVTLGYSRIGLKLNTTIKSKEYLAVGLPFITDTPIDVFHGEDKTYCLQVEYGDCPLKMQDILDFYDKMYGKGSLDKKREVALRMHEDALKCADIHTTMRPVIKYLQESNL